MSLYIKDTATSTEACVIWLHGLGADASDMAGLAEQLPLSDLALRHVFVDAPVRPVTLNGGMPMQAWYDIIGMKLTDREDKEGIKDSETHISSIVQGQIEQGFSSRQIFLAGFSQGGAMALYTSLQMAEPLAGVIALSAYLPLLSDIDVQQPSQLPLFMASGKFDPLVLPVWTRASVDWLESKGFTNISWHQYDMEHSVCMEEIKDIAVWLRQRVTKEAQ
ncbi:carboxylesterase [Legionella israelensis]|uniref:Carboxylesterase n=1 Tax=Legionella israelensis TaxID=454 RepID=A0AAX1EE99_9GAMM|nr:carboxylesterase [Legionella israelensis]QBR83187.1 carboxylesterase [Legionella israelensis]